MSRRANMRKRLAAEAARLMIEEDIKEYYTAKHLAADNLLGMRRTDTTPLPSNREIRAAVVERVGAQGPARDRQLRHLRLVALDVMQALARFDPRLIGSVASGAIHPGSDIDIQVFTRDHDRLERVLWVEGYDAERTEVDVVKDGRLRQFVHYHFEADGAPVELSVYAPEELYQVAISSIDGKPIDRLPAGRLLEVLRRAAPP